MDSDFQGIFWPTSLPCQPSTQPDSVESLISLLLADSWNIFRCPLMAFIAVDEVYSDIKFTRASDKSNTLIGKGLSALVAS